MFNNKIFLFFKLQDLDNLDKDSEENLSPAPVVPAVGGGDGSEEKVNIKRVK